MKIALAVERVPIASIEVGIRRRQKLGNLKSLARSIEAHGLLHPILLRQGKELVSGQRRLEACKLLGWTTVPARDVTGLSDDELRAVELEENTERLDLLNTETNTQRLREMRAQEVAARDELRGPGPQKGRPPEAGSTRSIARAAGVDEKTVRNMERHEATAERYPVFQRSSWRQYSVLEAGEKLATLPEKDRPAVAALIDQDAIPPKTAIAMIDNLAAMRPAERREVLTLAQSGDPHDLRVASTKAAAVPPPPDPGLMLWINVEETARRAAKACRVEPFKAEMTAQAAEMTSLLRAFKAHEEAHRCPAT